MHPRTALPLVLLFASGCVQVPAEGEALLNERSPVAAAPAPSSSTPPAAVTDVSPATRPAPVTIPAPKLQPAIEIAAPAPAVEAPPKSLWPRITNGFAMAPMDNDLVREWENWYSSRPDYVERMINRSGHFLFHIVEQVEK